MALKSIKVAVVGAGAVATKFHIPCYQKNRSTLLEAVVDSDPRRAKSVARRFRIRNWFSSFEELLESEIQIDAISLCTPPNFHAEIAVVALENGISVLCEKPLAENMASGMKILEAVHDSEAIFMIGFNRRFNQNYQRAKYLTHNGGLGHVYTVEYKSLQGNPLLGWSKSPWFYSKSEGGCLRDQGPHVFDILNWFLGRPVSVYAKRYIHLQSDVDESCFAIVTYEKGSVGIGEMSWLSPLKIEELEIFGTAKNIIASPEIFLELAGDSIPEIALFKAASPMYASKLKNVLGRYKPSTFQIEIDHFVDCVKSKRRPALTIQDGLRALALTEVALRSIQEDREIFLN